MTTTELYAVYCQAYGDAEFLRADGTSVQARTAIERAIAEFAVEDAANGTPMRSRAQFTRAVEAGLAALAPLGLRAA